MLVFLRFRPKNTFFSFLKNRLLYIMRITKSVLGGKGKQNLNILYRTRKGTHVVQATHTHHDTKHRHITATYYM